MSEDFQPQGKLLNVKDIVGKGGPVAGSAISIVGAVLALVGFVLPWASCGGYRLSGLDIVTQSASGDIGNANGTFLCLVPLLAVGVLGVAILVVPAALWKKIPRLIRLIGPALVSLLAAIACCPSCLFFTNLQSARNDPNALGMGGLIQIEYGFWVTVAGTAISFLGGLLGVGTSLAETAMSKKSSPG